MIITELMGNNKWLNPWIETQAEVSGNERKRRAERQTAGTRGAAEASPSRAAYSYDRSSAKESACRWIRAGTNLRGRLREGGSCTGAST